MRFNKDSSSLLIFSVILVRNTIIYLDLAKNLGNFFGCHSSWMLSKQAWIHPWKHDRHNFLSFLGHFLPFYPPNNLENQAFPKKWKCAWKYYRFTHMYHKWQSYDVWFLWYRVRRTWFFVILDHFLLFYSPNKLENRNFEKMKICLEILSFDTCAP